MAFLEEGQECREQLVLPRHGSLMEEPPLQGPWRGGSLDHHEARSTCVVGRPKSNVVMCCLLDRSSWLFWGQGHRLRGISGDPV